MIQGRFSCPETKYWPWREARPERKHPPTAIGSFRIASFARIPPSSPLSFIFISLFWICRPAFEGVEKASSHSNGLEKFVHVKRKRPAPEVQVHNPRCIDAYERPQLQGWAAGPKDEGHPEEVAIFCEEYATLLSVSIVARFHNHLPIPTFQFGRNLSTRPSSILSSSSEVNHTTAHGVTFTESDATTWLSMALEWWPAAILLSARSRRYCVTEWNAPA
mmetsp:Transcript_13834/g.31067  ORF Transcript_13834/g.31067 Transcript_13834/m.31067 type:complete len:219 (+) Transcript_13834:295-951(+)